LTGGNKTNLAPDGIEGKCFDGKESSGTTTEVKLTMAREGGMILDRGGRKRGHT